MPRDLHLVAALGQEGSIGSDTHPLRAHVRKQLTLLFSRHTPEDVILVRVLIERYQHAAVTAKGGRIAEAHADLAALASQVPPPPHEELGHLVDVAALPAWALVSWREGDHSTARQQLLHALDACAELSSRWGHDYLAAKQLHLAINLARVAMTAGDREHAGALLTALRAVGNGDRSRWPFAGAESLRVPLPYLERAAIDAQLERAIAQLKYQSR